MQYTGSVNKLIWYVLLPLVFLFYSAFIFWANLKINDGNRISIANQHIENVHTSSEFDGVILGGSNAVFSLSAEILNLKTGENWYNLSLLNQAYSDENYWNFIKSSMSERKRYSVRRVVYSSLAPLRDGHIEYRSNIKHGLEGDLSFKLIPELSVANYFVFFLRNGKMPQTIEYPLPNQFGDFRFEKFSCLLSENRSEFERKLHEEEVSFKFEKNLNEDRLSNWVTSELNSILSLFPNSEILFVLPSEYYQNTNNAERFKKTNEILATSITSFATDISTSINFVQQPLFPSLDILCDVSHHGNDSGRRWRTNNLLNHLEQIRLKHE